MRGLEGVRESDRVDEGVGGCKGGVKETGA